MLPHQERRETSLQKTIQVWINDPSGQHVTRTLTPNIVTPLWQPWLLYHANPSRFHGHQSAAPKMQPFANANDFPTNVLCNLHRRGPSLWHRAQEESCWVCIVLDGILSGCLKIRMPIFFVDPRSALLILTEDSTDFAAFQNWDVPMYPQKNSKLRILAFIRVGNQFSKQVSQAKPKKTTTPSHLATWPFYQVILVHHPFYQSPVQGCWGQL